MFRSPTALIIVVGALSRFIEANSVSTEATTIDYSCLHANSWIVNTNGYYNAYFNTATDCTFSYYDSSEPPGVNLWTAKFTGIPNYDRTFTSADIEKLNSRPKASSDFESGATTAVANEFVVFGQDIGYSSTACTMGYWPPGPECPAKLNGTYTFELSPKPETSTSGCRAYGSYGYYVNGVPVWSWTDSASYNSLGVWNNLAMEFEQYDMDVCMGHGAQDTYHHHSYSPCLAEQLGDDGTTGHSPIYGWAYDGYPIYGPWQSANTLAVPCWQARDYSSDSPTGCADGTRSCQLVDEFDYTKGTTTTSSSGPSVTGTTSTQSGNTIYAISGVYFEDYFYNSSCASVGGKYLNQYNGHSHDDYGFHYHVTVNSEMTPIFPYSVGPKFYGCMPKTRVCCSDKKCTGRATSSCGTTSGSSSLACKTSAPTPRPTTYSPTLTRSPTKTPTLKPTTNKPTTAGPTPKPTGPSYAPSILPTFSSNDRIDYSCLHSTAWLINTDNDYNDLFDAYTNILTSTYDSTSRPGKRQWTVSYKGIPNYDHVMTVEDIEAINGRQRASSEFPDGVTTAVVGQYVKFGDDIGYEAEECTIGYWPPGPVCPIPDDYSTTFSLTPSAELQTTGCYGKGQYGIYVNGAGLWSWADGGSYNSEKIWNSLAGAFEYYDVDFCNGHAAQGDYHHHGWSMCLAEKLGDLGDKHSPIHGFANDGYPIYGPWQSDNTLAVSCWQARDYSSTSPTGCSDGARSCVLVDEFDYTKGSVEVSAGPSLTSTMTTSTFNIISSASGIYYEDYFYNATCTEQGEQYLDAYNGHSHDDYGFHYHLTIDSSGTPLFPYSLGPKYYGCITSVPCCGDKLCEESGTSSCSSTQGTTSSSCTEAVAGTTPTPKPTTPAEPTYAPTTFEPTTAVPTTQTPTVAPTTGHPTSEPTFTPTIAPTTKAPTVAPTTGHPTMEPTLSPTSAPTTEAPTAAPTTEQPTQSPTQAPTFAPSTSAPTAPTDAPTAAPTTASPTFPPTPYPTTIAPSQSPTLEPTEARVVIVTFESTIGMNGVECDGVALSEATQQAIAAAAAISMGVSVETTEYVSSTFTLSSSSLSATSTTTMKNKHSLLDASNNLGWLLRGGNKQVTDTALYDVDSTVRTTLDLTTNQAAANDPETYYETLKTTLQTQVDGGGFATELTTQSVAYGSTELDNVEVTSVEVHDADIVQPTMSPTYPPSYAPTVATTSSNTNEETDNESNNSSSGGGLSTGGAVGIAIGIAVAIIIIAVIVYYAFCKNNNGSGGVVREKVPTKDITNEDNRGSEFLQVAHTHNNEIQV